jgi:potassium-dependent mechanosensitive channel
VLDSVLDYLREPIVVLSGTPVTSLTLITALAIVLIARIIAAIVGRSLERVLERRGVDHGLRHAVGKITRYALLLLGVFMALGTVGVDTSAIIGAGAVLLVGIGFGLQKLAENFISGLLVLIERPVRKGDFIDAGGVLGTVEDIGLRATRVLSRDGVMVIVPNSNLISSTVVNYRQPTPERRMWIDVGVAYGTDLELAVKVLKEVANREKLVQSKPPPEVRCTAFGDSAIHLSLLVWISEARDDLLAGSRLRFAIDKAFRAHGIEIPFPQRVVRMVPPKQVA